MSKQYIATIVEILDNGDAVLQFPPELVNDLGWDEGTEVEIQVDETGRIVIKRVV